VDANALSLLGNMQTAARTGKPERHISGLLLSPATAFIVRGAKLEWLIGVIGGQQLNPLVNTDKPQIWCVEEMTNGTLRVECKVEDGEKVYYNRFSRKCCIPILMFTVKSNGDVYMPFELAERSANRGDEDWRYPEGNPACRNDH